MVNRSVHFILFGGKCLFKLKVGAVTRARIVSGTLAQEMETDFTALRFTQFTC
jgi:hypothetical protein